jgi:Calcineurin-like phosphoesterase
MSRARSKIEAVCFAAWLVAGCANRALPPSPSGPSSTTAGTTTAGTTTAGTTTAGTTTAGTTTGTTTGTTGIATGCAHDYCMSGGKLDPACDPCVAEICAADSYCCVNHWSGPCVAEVGSICNYICAGGTTAGGTTGGVPTGPSTTTGTTAGGGTRALLLHFAVFGDARPPNQDDIAGYPSAIIGGIFSLAQSRGAQFIVGTGDYMYASTQASVSAQIALFLQARANYAGPLFLTMGNHECNGYTNSNCPNLNEAPNIQGFMAQLVPPGVTQPFYRVDYATPMGTAKLLFVAANAWSTAQSTWLTAQLADPTTYTFVVRHEPSYDDTAPGVTPSDTAVNAAPYTIELLGHTHEYRHLDTQHVISGNAGAPFDDGWNSYGMLFVDQQMNGNITVTEVDEATGSTIDTWTVTPTGQPVP